MARHKRSKHKDPIQRFFSYVSFAPSGCWEWVGGRHKEGYGVIAWRWPEYRAIGAHRIAYAYWHGPIGDGLVVDHIRENTSCVRPEHLRATTRTENLLRDPESNRSRTSCRRCGTALTPVYLGAKKRGCNPCHKRQVSEYASRRRKKEKAYA